jgi:NADH-quinone oxidoreductase subunit L
MLVPLAVLALLSIGGGFAFKVPEFLGAAGGDEDRALMAISTAAGVIGIALAWLMYVARPALADSFAASVKGLYTLVYNKYFVDEIYAAAMVNPVVNGSREVLWKAADVGLIDGAANGVAARARNIGGVLRLMQSGNIRSYATWVLFGSVLLIVAMGIAGGLR